MRKITGCLQIAILLILSGFCQMNHEMSLIYDFEALLGTVNDVSEKDLQLLDRVRDLYLKGVSAIKLNHDGKAPRIPHVLHVIWLGPRPFPKESMLNLYAWRNCHPDWKIKFWTDDPHRHLGLFKGMELHLVSEVSFTDLEDCYYATRNFGEKSDILRYEILYKEGGVYIDHDVICHKPFYELCENLTFFAGLEPFHDHLSRETKVLVGNCIIGVSPRHPIMKKTIYYVSSRWKELSAKSFSPSPDYDSFLRVLHRTYDAFNFAVFDEMDKKGYCDIVLPPVYFYAGYLYHDRWNYMKIKSAGMRFAQHYWQHEWIGEHTWK